MKILFSPVGMTDPISNYHDGALLHICRYYRPDVVYLYYSQEICKIEREDDRYRYCLERLQEKLGIRFEIRVIRREDLVDVHVFDFFMKEFREILQEIRRCYPEDELLLNVSSGTPAMKSALEKMAVLLEDRMIPIQVSTPRKSSNVHHEEREAYDKEFYWEMNEDNEEGSENRCTEFTSNNFFYEIQKGIARKHIQAYDYVAAREIARRIGILDPRCMAAIQGACDRMKLDYQAAEKKFNLAGFSGIPVKKGRMADIVEYYLWLSIKVKREEYADFLRGITPLLVDVFESVLRKQCGIELPSLTYEDSKKRIRGWSEGKLRKHPEILETLKYKYKEKGGFRMGPVNSDSLNALLQAYCNDEATRRNADLIRGVEETIRNMAAHQIIAITKTRIQDLTGEDPESILRALRGLILVFFNGDRDILVHSYERMNENLIALL
ncbi:MAG TPA: hypothetical protein DF613_07565 [Lachnospiraceae bacterium]|nr:hypothetical protein [Lachnospiraceae bacterium]